MSNIARQIRDGYKSICDSKTGEDAVRRYADYHQEMLSLPPMESGQIIEAADLTSDIDISTLWDTHTTTPGVPYFHGSGLVAVGNVAEGKVIAVTAGPLSDTEQDLVQKKYNNYRNYVPLFLGASAMLIVLGVQESNLGHEAYVRYTEILKSTGILESSKVPHLGNSQRLQKTGNRVLKLSAGASGVLPSSKVALAFAVDLANEFKADSQAGLLSWEWDAAAGYHDEVANQQALDLASGIELKTLDLAICINEARARHANGQDID